MFSRWLSDLSVTRYLTDGVGQSFVAGIKVSGANLHKAILSHAARRMATHLFIEIEFLKRHFQTAACFLRGFLGRVSFHTLQDE